MQKLVGAVVILAGLVVLALLFTQFRKWMDRSDNAWAYANPPFTGNWQGDAMAGNKRVRLVVSLSRDKFDWLSQGDSVDNHRTLSGQAMFCDSTGRVQAYSVAGLVKDSHARSTLLNLSPPPDETPGLRPTRIDLTWDGSTALSGKVHLAHAQPGGGTITSSSDAETGHPIPLLLRPATAGQTCTPPTASH